ncbi:MAG: selenide, water dikinase SelD [Henriciella sp.]
MNASRPLPITRDLVLLGGGHAHALVLRKWAMSPLPGAQITLVNPQVKAPYTGMLPGFVAGHYEREELDIDLVKLARQANARLVVDHAVGLDLETKRVQLSASPDLAYDVLSIDIGITSRLIDLPGADRYLIPAKPLGAFSRAWSDLVARATSTGVTPEIAVLGGGVAGVELALAMAFRLETELGGRGRVRLIEAKSEILAELGSRARRVLIEALARAHVETVLNTTVTEISENGVHTGSQIPAIKANFVVSAAGARPHAWLEETALNLSDGYISVDDHLQAIGTESIYATGDCAHLSHAPRPKAGVFAVRQAPVLFDNLRAELSGGTRRTYSPQKDYLKLISIGRQAAVTDKWGIGVSGDWVWRLKDRIDRKFMDQFRTVMEMPAPSPPLKAAFGVSEYLQENENPCAGCGAKVAQGALSTGLGAAPDRMEDAAILQREDHVQVFSTDHLRAFSPDPYIQAKIAATHALGDIWAMGASPETALSHVILPPLARYKQANMLREIMAGAREVIESSGAKIAGGHTSSGAELTIGFSLSGIARSNVIQQNGAKPGDVIVLTKPIGTGVLLAAEMRQVADGDHYQAAIESMLRSQATASEILASAATAMTDVTGFGLAGHLLNILIASDVAATLDGSQIPILDGALAAAKAGIRSTLWPSNMAQASYLQMPDGPLKDILFDPQTCGGLLATISKAESDRVLADFAAKNEPIWQLGDVTAGPPLITVLDQPEA